MKIFFGLLFLCYLFCRFALAETTEASRNFSYHGQLTTVSQDKGAMPSAYSSTYSLATGHESRTSLTATGFFGARLWQGAEAYFNPEVSAGSGLSGTHGMAGFPNGEIYRVDMPRPKENLSRLYLRQVFSFGEATETVEDAANKIAGTLPVQRLSVIFGKFSLNDFFDDNIYSQDPRSQFLNWALMDNGAWDYAADTKGYTYGVYLEWNRADWAVRFARVTEPKQANQMAMDLHLAQAYSNNLEFEVRQKIENHPGKVRLMVYQNSANMGSYRQTLNTPAYNNDVTQSRAYSKKYGIGLNGEQELLDHVGAFLRAGWSDGKRETWAFTEIDQTLSFGLSLEGDLWGRKPDTFGLAFIGNGLSRDHRDYLKAGGSGFMLGDGGLNYGLEKIIEGYYLWRPLGKYLGLSGDIQYVANPGYNLARGPAWILGARMHWEI